MVSYQVCVCVCVCLLSAGKPWPVGCGGPQASLALLQHEKKEFNYEVTP